MGGYRHRLIAYEVISIGLPKLVVLSFAASKPPL